MNVREMRLEEENRRLLGRVDKLMKEKTDLVEVVKGNVEDMKAIERKLNEKENEFVEVIRRLTNENYALKEEVVMINKERERTERLKRESEDMVGILRAKVDSLSKLIIENEKIRSDLNSIIARNNNGHNIAAMRNEQKDKPISVPIAKIESTGKEKAQYPINDSNQMNSHQIWSIISDIKSHISQEQSRLNQNRPD